jgi:hypothetical protein
MYDAAVTGEVFTTLFNYTVANGAKCKHSPIRDLIICRAAEDLIDMYASL